MTSRSPNHILFDGNNHYDSEGEEKYDASHISLSDSGSEGLWDEGAFSPRDTSFKLRHIPGKSTEEDPYSCDEDLRVYKGVLRSNPDKESLLLKRKVSKKKSASPRNKLR